VRFSVGCYTSTYVNSLVFSAGRLTNFILKIHFRSISEFVPEAITIVHNMCIVSNSCINLYALSDVWLIMCGCFLKFTFVQCHRICICGFLNQRPSWIVRNMCIVSKSCVNLSTLLDVWLFMYGCWNLKPTCLVVAGLEKCFEKPKSRPTKSAAFWGHLPLSRHVTKISRISRKKEDRKEMFAVKVPYRCWNSSAKFGNLIFRK